MARHLCVSEGQMILFKMQEASVAYFGHFVEREEGGGGGGGGGGVKTDEYVYRCPTLYRSMHGAVGTLHTCLLLSNFQQIHVHCTCTSQCLHLPHSSRNQ